MKRQHRAFSLVELLTVIATGSVILVLAMKMVHQTMHIESQADNHARVERVATQLSRQFRHDVHRAMSFSLAADSADTTALLLTLPDELPISYRIEDSCLLRQQKVNQHQTHRQQFCFPENYVIRIRELKNPQRISVSVERSTNLADLATQNVLQVEAVLGQLLDLQQTAAASQ